MALTLQLEINSKKKTFIAPSPKARIIRTSMEITEKADKQGMSTAILDEMIELVVNIFGNKFTTDDVWDGLNADKLMPEILRIINSIGDGMDEKVAEFPNGAAAK